MSTPNLAVQIIHLLNNPRLVTLSGSFEEGIGEVQRLISRARIARIPLVISEMEAPAHPDLLGYGRVYYQSRHDFRKYPIPPQLENAERYVVAGAVIDDCVSHVTENRMQAGKPVSTAKTVSFELHPDHDIEPTRPPDWVFPGTMYETLDELFAAEGF